MGEQPEKVPKIVNEDTLVKTEVANSGRPSFFDERNFDHQTSDPEQVLRMYASAFGDGNFANAENDGYYKLARLIIDAENSLRQLGATPEGKASDEYNELYNTLLDLREANEDKKYVHPHMTTGFDDYLIGLIDRYK